MGQEVSKTLLDFLSKNLTLFPVESWMRWRSLNRGWRDAMEPILLRTLTLHPERVAVFFRGTVIPPFLKGVRATKGKLEASEDLMRTFRDHQGSRGTAVEDLTVICDSSFLNGPMGWMLLPHVTSASCIRLRGKSPTPFVKWCNMGLHTRVRTLRLRNLEMDPTTLRSIILSLENLETLHMRDVRIRGCPGRCCDRDNHCFCKPQFQTLRLRTVFIRGDCSQMCCNSPHLGDFIWETSTFPEPQTLQYSGGLRIHADELIIERASRVLPRHPRSNTWRFCVRA